MASFRVGFEPSLLMTDLPADHMVQNQGSIMVLMATEEAGLYEGEPVYVDPLGTAVFPAGTPMIWARAPSATRPGQYVRVFVGPIAGGL